MSETVLEGRDKREGVGLRVVAGQRLAPESGWPLLAASQSVGVVDGHMLVAEVLSGWRPGSYDPPWSWEDEANDLAGRPESRALADDMERHGLQHPVLLGPDGRVWNGHHRLVLAWRMGWVWIPVKLASEGSTRPRIGSRR